MYQSSIAGTICTWIWSQWDAHGHTELCKNFQFRWLMGTRTRNRNQWLWLQSGLIYTRYLLIIHSIFLQFRLFIGALITKTLQQCLLSALLTDDFIVHYTYVQLSGKVLFFHLSVNETGILQTTAGFQTRQWLQGKSWSLPAKREQTL